MRRSPWCRLTSASLSGKACRAQPGRAGRGRDAVHAWPMMLPGRTWHLSRACHLQLQIMQGHGAALAAVHLPRGWLPSTRLCCAVQALPHRLFQQRLIRAPPHVREACYCRICLLSLHWRRRCTVRRTATLECGQVPAAGAFGICCKEQHTLATALRQNRVLLPG